MIYILMIRSGIAQRNQGFGVYESSYNKQARHGPGAPNHEERPFVFVAGPSVDRINYSDAQRPENITRSERSINYGDLFAKRPTDLVKQLADILSRTVGKTAGPGGPSGPGTGLGGGSVGQTIGAAPAAREFTTMETAITAPVKVESPTVKSPDIKMESPTVKSPDIIEPAIKMESPTVKMENLPTPASITKSIEQIFEMDVVNSVAEDYAAKLKRLGERYEKLYYVSGYGPAESKKRPNEFDSTPSKRQRMGTESVVIPKQIEPSTDLSNLKNQLQITYPNADFSTFDEDPDLSNLKNQLQGVYPNADFSTFDEDLNSNGIVSPIEKAAHVLLQIEDVNMKLLDEVHKEKATRKPKERRSGGEKYSPYKKASRKKKAELEEAERIKASRENLAERVEEGKSKQDEGEIKEMKRRVKLYKGREKKGKLTNKEYFALTTAERKIKEYEDRIKKNE